MQNSRRKIILTLSLTVLLHQLFSQSFSCDKRLYFFQADGINGTLSYVDDYVTTLPVVTALCPMQSFRHNSMGANPADKYLYYSEDTSLYRLDASCHSTLMCDSLPLAASGCFDDLGRYWFTSDSLLYALDVNTCQYLKGPFPIPANGPDIVYNRITKMLYLSVSGGGKILVFDTLGNTRDSITILPDNGVNINWSGIAFGKDGNLYAVSRVSPNIESIPFIPFTSYTTSITVVTVLNPGPTYGYSDMASFLCDPILTVQVDQTNINCSGYNNGEATASASEGIPPYSYLWSPGDLTTGSITGLSPGTYSVTVKDAVDSSVVAFVNITAPSILTVHISNAATVCSGTTLQLTASATGGTAGYFYLWSNSNTESSISMTPTDSSSFVVIAFDANNCRDTALTTVSLYPNPVITVMDVSVCPGNNATLNATGADMYYWFPSVGLNSTLGPDVMVNLSGTQSYTVTGTSLEGCIGSGVAEVKVYDSPVVTIPSEVFFNEGSSLSLNADGGVNYHWFPSAGLNCTDCQNPFVTVHETTTYHVTVTDENGCSNTDSVIVNVLRNDAIFIPSVFTPNNDNRNDVFQVYSKEVTLQEMKIFNRWGVVVFQTSDVNQGWDGKYLNEVCPEDVYVFSLRYKKDEQILTLADKVILLR